MATSIALMWSGVCLQAMAYSLLMEPVKLVSRVPGTTWTWAELVASGMAHAVFLVRHNQSSPQGTTVATLYMSLLAHAYVIISLTFTVVSYYSSVPDYCITFLCRTPKML